MKIVYMGTPEFAVPALRRLAEAGVDIPLVVTQPDKPKDRGKKLQPTPVKELAESLGIPVVQPEFLKGNTELFEMLASHEPDLIVVAAYGRILPEEILTLPKNGCVNLHGSLLPKYRGAAPIQRAVLEGAEETGVTLMYMSRGMDEGDMIASVKTPVDGKTSGQLFAELAEAGAALLIEHLDELLTGQAGREPQDPSQATYAAMISKKDGLVDFSEGSNAIERKIRAMDPWPGAYTYYKGESMKLLAALAEPKDIVTEGKPGQILSAGNHGIKIATGKGTLTVTKLQMAGKKAMDVSAYLKGNQIEIGTILG